VLFRRGEKRMAVLRKKSVSKYVRKYGMTVEELGKELGVVPATVIRWLRVPSMEAEIMKRYKLPRKYNPFIE